ncbi:ubiquinone biosynthesis O-methyltransferase, mitochondrial-like [Brevipalpus obovatus]|uniref:ubiquinone biosynthesis O-methyltransferase, mitochondrial-like n=1 Tax=Brevipalpus obovatus TaxID=246614 RepID=UPI003D9E4066
MSTSDFVAPEDSSKSKKTVTKVQQTINNDNIDDTGEAKSDNIYEGRKFDWWENKKGSMYALYIMNELRVPVVQETLLGNRNPKNANKPLSGFHIIDVGCGGGLMCEPLAKLGAQVIGIDISKESIEAAEEHMNEFSPELKNNLKYMNISIENLIREQKKLKFDAVVASEVVEHVDNLEEFTMNCMKLVKPGGYLIITTINRTFAAYFCHILMAEKILGLAPQGLHPYDMLVQPAELEAIIEKGGFDIKSLRGILYNPLTQRWNWSWTTMVNYCMVSQRKKN